MSFSIAVKEKIAQAIAEHFTTNDIVNVFNDANIPTDKSLYAKWRIVLDAFSKMSDPETIIPHIIIAFCHPLHFPDVQTQNIFIEKLNTILAYENLKIESSDRNIQINPIDGAPLSDTTKVKTSIDYVIDAVNFFKNEYNKIRMSGLTYDYSLGENISSEQLENGREEYDEKLKAIEQLKKIGFITEYEIDARVECEGYYIWDYAVCKIDEDKLTQKEKSRATEANVKELIQKIEITAMPELVVRNTEDNTLIKGKKRIHLPKFKSTNWSKIIIRFLDKRNILITANKKENIPADYETLGFRNDKTEKPNTAWGFFYGLAQNNGETKLLPTPIPDNIKQLKRQLSDRLKTIFKNDTDPFYDPTETHIYKMKIKLIPPQSEEEPDDLGVQDYLKETMTEEYEEPYNE